MWDLLFFHKVGLFIDRVMLSFSFTLFGKKIYPIALSLLLSIFIFIMWIVITA